MSGGWVLLAQPPPGEEASWGLPSSPPGSCIWVSLGLERVDQPWLQVCASPWVFVGSQLHVYVSTQLSMCESVSSCAARGSPAWQIPGQRGGQGQMTWGTRTLPGPASLVLPVTQQQGTHRGAVGSTSLWVNLSISRGVALLIQVPSIVPTVIPSITPCVPSTSVAPSRSQSAVLLGSGSLSWCPLALHGLSHPPGAAQGVLGQENQGLELCSGWGCWGSFPLPSAAAASPPCSLVPFFPVHCQPWEEGLCVWQCVTHISALRPCPSSMLCSPAVLPLRVRGHGVALPQGCCVPGTAQATTEQGKGLHGASPGRERGWQG